jgi:hypothetical protein
MTLFIQIILSLVFPTLIWLAIRNMKSRIPKWILLTLILSALIYVVIAIPWILMSPTTQHLILNLSVEDRAKLSIYSAILNIIKNILVAAALLGMSILIKTQNQKIGPDALNTTSGQRDKPE